ncbi:cysteine desulfurase family protein [Apilactobacillus ozensis]|uniref:Cysteine desulfurase n=1 Tax=Apilactobacillus ozensis DSM 23829 = JCM 17196 TaxID=1423781 RepID=A0A0R2ALC2_9LACO|nr:cysteine desulfurase family protein [Apilactobacillus ozensis]KRM67789.1 cysteine desulfurase [Apilactobacillus ozensis DSM 23829 = JCM 17196]MCK8606936.1 cysteine desulfurase [Apilactobacillus ozensis]
MIYFDNSATTKVNSESLDTYVKVSESIWGNPSSLHDFGEKSFQLLQQSRKQIANLLNVRTNEIYFTSGGTEGDNWVIKGTALAKQQYGKHIITTSIEHPAVINTCKQLEKQGYDVTYLPVDKSGRISLSALKSAIRKDTILVSIMLVNNEIGSIQPIVEAAEVLKNFPSIHFHVDAVQGIGKGLNYILKNNRIDFLTFSGHKFHAPRGIGFIYKKFGRHIESLMDGGGQESNLRSGTENLPAIASMAKSLRLLMEDESSSVNNQISIKKIIYNHLDKFENVTIFSKLDEKEFAPHILCFAISGVRGETIVHAFEDNGIYISTTSACSSKKKETSGTLNAMEVPQSLSDSAVRVSLDENNTIEEARQFNQVFDVLYAKFSKING